MNDFIFRMGEGPEQYLATFFNCLYLDIINFRFVPA